jgi:hypothetical protein
MNFSNISNLWKPRYRNKFINDMNISDIKILTPFNKIKREDKVVSVPTISNRSASLPVVKLFFINDKMVWGNI